MTVEAVSGWVLIPRILEDFFVLNQSDRASRLISAGEKYKTSLLLLKVCKIWLTEIILANSYSNGKQLTAKREAGGFQDRNFCQ